MESFFVAVNAVMPMFIFLCVGFFVKKMDLATEEFLKKLNTFIFQAFFPFVTFYNVYQTDIAASVNIRMTAYSFILILVATVLLVAFVPKVIKKNAVRGVYIQACVRSNFVLFGMALAASVYGDKNLGMVSIALAIIVPTFNILSVIVLEIFRGGEIDVKGICTAIYKNPLIIGAVLGFAYNLLSIPTPEFFAKAIKDLASMTTPLAILVLGGTLKFSSIRANLKYLSTGILFKLVIFPLIGVSIAIAMGFRGLELFTVLAVFGSPVAASSYAMAQSMDGDYELAGQFIALSTIAALFTMFLFIFALDTMALI